jgi:transposase
MTEIGKELKAGLVVGRKSDGRCVYDAQVKRQVVQACMRPGVSVARVALQVGVNANLLRRWITLTGASTPATAPTTTVPPASPSAFVAVQLPQVVHAAAAAPSPPPPSPPPLQAQVRLPNGVQVELACADPAQWAVFMQSLAGLTCSS